MQLIGAHHKHWVVSLKKICFDHLTSTCDGDPPARGSDTAASERVLAGTLVSPRRDLGLYLNDPLGDPTRTAIDLIASTKFKFAFVRTNNISLLFN